MSIESVITSHIHQIAAESGRLVAPLSHELSLRDSGLDSLALAILVARLEEALGLDPFTDTDEPSYPVTVGDFIKLYENAVQSSPLDSGQAG